VGEKDSAPLLLQGTDTGDGLGVLLARDDAVAALVPQRLEVPRELSGVGKRGGGR